MSREARGLPVQCRPEFIAAAELGNERFQGASGDGTLLRSKSEQSPAHL